MRAKEFIIESAASELAKRMHSLPDYKYKTIDSLMKKISNSHQISPTDLHHVFVDKYGYTPDHYIKDKAANKAVKELTKKLPSLAKHDDSVIHDLVKKVAKQHKITHNSLVDLFNKKHKLKPHHYAKDKLKESALTFTTSDNSTKRDFGDNPIVKKFIKWCSKKLQLQSEPKFEFSYDTDEAQEGHHTGRHVEGSNEIWVYVDKRNLVDVLRTVAHELRHVQQSEQGKIKPGSSYPFSPIEKDADVWAGGVIKIFGKQHPEIFQ